MALFYLKGGEHYFGVLRRGERKRREK